MSIFSHFLRSVLVTSLLSFAVPSLVLGLGVASMVAIGYLPGLGSLSESAVKQLLQFLSTFGSGSPVQGVVVIGLTCSLVGALFDAYAFYRSQNLRGGN